MLSREVLFARLAEGHAARVTVVTPNTRLAQSLLAEFDRHQAGKNLNVWEAPDILPFTALVQRLYDDALYSDAAGAAELPMLLTPAQERLLWVQAIESHKTDLLAIEEAASACSDAWRLVHAWCIRSGQGNEDAAAFSRWSETYRNKTSGDVDSARLPDVVASLLTSLDKPKALVAYGFDIVTPQLEEFLAACGAAGVEVMHCHPQNKDSIRNRAVFPSPREELEAAARWARGKLE